MRQRTTPKLFAGMRYASSGRVRNDIEAAIRIPNTYRCMRCLAIAASALLTVATVSAGCDETPIRERSVTPENAQQVVQEAIQSGELSAEEQRALAAYYGTRTMPLVGQSEELRGTVGSLVERALREQRELHERIQQERQAADEALARGGRLQVRSTTAAVGEVHVNGSFVGTTPVEIQLAPGTHVVAVGSSDDAQRYEVEMDSEGEEVLEVAVRDPQSGLVIPRAL